MAQTKSKKVVGLFVAAALAVSGCSSEDDYDDCYDNDNDGYCDDSSSGGSGSTYRSYKSKSGVSSGMSTSSSKGGIGSSGYSSSG
ncbi:hypothetical protein ABH14_12290 [Brevibacillus brevis]|uniref:hypothetical protein n=1 Tax=Brevibacillus brevis TaxID=1393 RepID=UPI0019007E43|nr:hypothetical protein [Brevibacillus brevis]MBH0330565.1 hypothetical protein [Brevibacillus brevis]